MAETSAVFCVTAKLWPSSDITIRVPLFLDSEGDTNLSLAEKSGPLFRDRSSVTQNPILGGTVYL